MSTAVHAQRAQRKLSNLDARLKYRRADNANTIALLTNHTKLASEKPRGQVLLLTRGTLQV